MSTRRVSKDAGWVDPGKLPKGPNGRNLCRQCGEEVPKGRRTFCSEDCVDRWKIKTDPGHVRLLVFRRDQGVCAACGIDTTKLPALVRDLRRRAEEVLTPEGRRWFSHEFLQGIQGLVPSGRRSYWDADHIVPVVEGGGECDLDNYRTLCCWCHRKATAALAARRAEHRRREKASIQTPGLFDQEKTA